MRSNVLLIGCLNFKIVKHVTKGYNLVRFGLDFFATLFLDGFTPKRQEVVLDIYPGI